MRTACHSGRPTCVQESLSKHLRGSAPAAPVVSSSALRCLSLLPSLPLPTSSPAFGAHFPNRLPGSSPCSRPRFGEESKLRHQSFPLPLPPSFLSPVSIDSQLPHFALLTPDLSNMSECLPLVFTSRLKTHLALVPGWILTNHLLKPSYPPLRNKNPLISSTLHKVKAECLALGSKTSMVWALPCVPDFFPLLHTFSANL